MVFGTLVLGQEGDFNACPEHVAMRALVACGERQGKKLGSSG